MRSQVETKNESCEDYEASDLIYHHYVNRLVLKLRKIEYQFASVSSKQRRKRGRHLPNSRNTIAVRIEVAIHSTEERLVVYDDRVLDGCKTSNDGKMILFRDIRRAPKKRSVVYLILLKAHRLLMHPLLHVTKSMIITISSRNSDYQKDGEYSHARIVCTTSSTSDKIENNANDIPDTWSNSTIAHDCLWTITRGVDEDDEEAHMDAVYEQMRVLGTYSITSLEATRTMIEHMVERNVSLYMSELTYTLWELI
jgi:hypothetical protein